MEFYNWIQNDSIPGIEISFYESCDSALHYPSSLSTLVGFDLLNCTTFCIDQLMEKMMASDTQLEILYLIDRCNKVGNPL